jgi:hypothetical protein
MSFAGESRARGVVRVLEKRISKEARVGLCI